MLFKLNILRQKLTRKDTEPSSPEIVLDSPAMDIDQGDTNSLNPGGSRPWDAYVLIHYYVSISTHPTSRNHQVSRIPTMPLLGASHATAIPANARSPETLDQCGRSRCGSGEKEKTVSNQRLSMDLKLKVLW